MQAGDDARADQGDAVLAAGADGPDDAGLARGVGLALGAGHRPPARPQRVGGERLLDDGVGAEVRVPRGLEDPRGRRGAVDDRAAVVDDVGDAGGEAGAGLAGRGQQPGVGGVRRAGGAEADDAAATGDERVVRGLVGRVERGRVQRGADDEDVDVGGQLRGQRRRGDLLGREAELAEHVPHLGAAGVGHDDLVGDRRAAPGRRGAREREAARLGLRQRRGASAGAGSAPSRRTAA